MQTLILSLVFASLFFSILRISNLKAQILLLLGLALVPLFSVYFGNPSFRLYAWHGFMHMGIVYQIMNGNIPPENPLLAGHTLLYPWANHWLISGIVSTLNTSPANIFFTLNLVYLWLTVIIVFKISVFITFNKKSGIFSAFLAVFGMTFFSRGFLHEKALSKLLSILNVHVDERAIPVFFKFVSSGINQLGILLFALFLYLSIHIFSTKSNSKVRPIYWLGFFLVCTLTTFFYPIYMPALVASTFACCAVMFLYGKKQFLSKIYMTLICLCVGVSLFVPYLYQIAAEKSDAASISIGIFNPQHLIHNGLAYILATLPLAIVLVWKREALRSAFLKKPVAILILATVTIVTAGLFIVMKGSTTSVEYKYLILTCFTIGIIGGIAFKEFYQSNQILAFLLTTSFLLPISAVVFMVNSHLPISQEYREVGKSIITTNPSEQALYDWIIQETSSDSVFIDSQRKTTVLGQRQLYIGLDLEGKHSDFYPARLDGWWSESARLLYEQGYPTEILELRRRVVEDIYDRTKTQLNDELFSELSKVASEHATYIVCRTESIESKFINDNRFKKVFSLDNFALYQFST